MSIISTVGISICGHCNVLTIGGLLRPVWSVDTDQTASFSSSDQCQYFSSSLATGVVQLYLAEAPGRQRWNKRCCGVVCFIKDNRKKSYYIRLYDPKSKQMAWEQELYTQFKYKTPREYFHTFEAHDCQAGLNFASENEAAKFKKVIESKLMERHKRRMDRKKDKQQMGGVQTRSSTMGTITVGSGPPPASANVTLNKPAPNTTKEVSSSKKSKDKKKKGRLTKEDISTPTDFRHVSHVGWDPNTGLDMKKLDPEMKSLFEQIGIDDQTQVDEETIDFIYDFVDKHGGLNAVREDLAKRRPPPAPTQSAAPPPPPPAARPPASTPSMRPPAPPNRSGPPAPPHHRGMAPPPPPHGRQGMAPPPPPPNRNSSTLPPAPARQSHPPPPPPNRAVAAPPPPPPPGNIPAPPPPPPAAPVAPPPPPMGGGGMGGHTPSLPASNQDRGGLLSQIHKGTALRHVDPEEHSSGGSSSGGRSGLLSEIRAGATLKAVDHSHDAPPAQASGGGIVGALAQALAMRKQVIQGSDDEDDSSDDMDDDDDDEWED